MKGAGTGNEQLRAAGQQPSQPAHPGPGGRAGTGDVAGGDEAVHPLLAAEILSDDGDPAGSGRWRRQAVQRRPCGVEVGKDADHRPVVGLTGALSRATPRCRSSQVDRLSWSRCWGKSSPCRSSLPRFVAAGSFVSLSLLRCRWRAHSRRSNAWNAHAVPDDPMADGSRRPFVRQAADERLRRLRYLTNIASGPTRRLAELPMRPPARVSWAASTPARMSPTHPPRRETGRSGRSRRR